MEPVIFDCSHLHRPEPNGHADCPYCNTVACSCNQYPHTDPLPVVYTDINGDRNPYRYTVSNPDEHADASADRRPLLEPGLERGDLPLA